MLYHLYFFSATGNTAHCAKMIEEELMRAGHRVRAVSINRWTQPLAEMPDRLILAYPTFAWRPPALVKRFISRLPLGAGREAAVLTSDGGGSFGSVDVTGGLLNARGYRTTLKAAVSYPNNWAQMTSPPTGEARERKIREGVASTRRFIQALLEEKALPHARKSFYGYFNLLGLLFSAFGRRFLGKLFVADDDCTSCGLCARTCPVGAISLGKGPGARPYWKFNCESCNRCVNLCPTKAINTSLPRGILLVCAIAGLSVLGFLLNGAYLHPIYAKLPTVVAGTLGILAMLVILVASQVLALTLVDALILRPLQSLRPVRRLLQKGFTKGFNRYAYEGFKAPIESVEKE